MTFAFTFATKSKSNNTLKNEGGNEKRKPEQEQSTKNQKTREHTRHQDSLWCFPKLTTYHLFEMIPSNFQGPAVLNSFLYTPPMSHSINSDDFTIQQ